MLIREEYETKRVHNNFLEVFPKYGYQNIVNKTYFLSIFKCFLQQILFKIIKYMIVLVIKEHPTVIMKPMPNMIFKNKKSSQKGMPF